MNFSNIYNKTLFVRNYFSKCSEEYFKINFVISDTKVYLAKVFPLNTHKATRLNVTNILLIFNTKTTDLA